MTTVSDGLFQYGGMPVNGAVPPFVSRYSKTFFVDPVNGLDGNSGESPSQAFATLYRAHKMCTAGQNDVVYLIGTGAAAGTARLSTANAIAGDSSLTTGELIWSKNATHLIGIAAPGVNSRARIANPTGTYTAATFGSNAFMTVSGNGCYIANISLTQSFSTGNAAEITLTVTGSYNVFDNVFASGPLSAAGYQGANSRALKVSTGGENIFLGGQYGADTVTRSALNANVEFASATARNRFDKVIFPMYTDDATAVGILGTGAGCMDRFQLFTNCWFINAIESGSTGATALANLTSASAGGMLVFANCNLIGFTKWGDTNALAQSYVSNVGGAATDGLMLAPT